MPNESYYVVVKHRNHLGVMTAEPIDFASEEAIEIDFKDSDTPNFGTNAQTQLNNVMAM